MDVNNLQRFFDRLRIKLGTADDFGSFFEQLSTVLSATDELILDVTQFRVFLDQLREPIASALKAGEFLNVWTVAGVDRDEVRNCAVLSWLFNCHESHGQGSASLRSFLTRLRLPSDLDNCRLEKYSTSVETYPLGNADTRVDIEINTDDFLRFIEAKVGATFDVCQIRRLKRLATEKAKTFDRTPIIVFLCLSKNIWQASKHDVVLATWNDVAEAVRAYLRETAGRLPKHLRLTLK
jgi:PD-(D/E)XK nuclease superfamily